MKEELRARMAEKLRQFNDRVDLRHAHHAEHALRARAAEALFGECLHAIIMPALTEIGAVLMKLKHEPYVFLKPHSAGIRIRPYGDDRAGWPHVALVFPEVSFSFHYPNQKAMVSLWQNAEGHAKTDEHFVAVEQITADSVHASVVELVDHMTKAED